MVSGAIYTLHKKYCNQEVLIASWKSNHAKNINSHQRPHLSAKWKGMSRVLTEPSTSSKAHKEHLGMELALNLLELCEIMPYVGLRRTACMLTVKAATFGPWMDSHTSRTPKRGAYITRNWAERQCRDCLGFPDGFSST